MAIVLKYEISGTPYKKRYKEKQYQRARQRINFLREHSIPVQVKGFPRTVNVRQPKGVVE